MDLLRAVRQQWSERERAPALFWACWSEEEESRLVHSDTIGEEGEKYIYPPAPTVTLIRR